MLSLPIKVRAKPDKTPSSAQTSQPEKSPGFGVVAVVVMSVNYCRLFIRILLLRGVWVLGHRPLL